jgi:ABC-type uncharacterized transport system permease subunit
LLGGFAVLLHAALLYQNTVIFSAHSLSFLYLLSLVVWSLCALSWLVSFYRPLQNLLILIFPLAIPTILLCLLFSPSINQGTNASLGQAAHLILAVLTFAVVCLAALQAILLQIQDRLLHHYQHENPFLKKLPPLQTMERWLFQTILLGFVLLTVMLISSFYFFADIFQAPLLQKTVLTVVAWGIFALLLLGRHCFGWRGHKAVYYTLAGFVLLIVIYFGSEFFYAST